MRAPLVLLPPNPYHSPTNTPHTMNWRKTLSYLEPSFVEHPVGGKLQKFYPIPLALLFELRAIGKPLAQALSDLFSKDDFRGTTMRDFVDPETGSQGSETIVEPLSPEMLSIQTSRRKEAWGTLLDTLTSQENLRVVGRLIVESLREVFGTERLPDDEVDAFIQSQPLPQIPEYLAGVFKANRGLFGPLASQLGGLGDKIKSALEDQLAETPTPKPSEDPGEE